MSRSAKVDVFMANLDHPCKREIEALRAVVLAADGRIRESVKWNAPSFYVTEHFVTFKLRPEGAVQLVFHRGAKVRDDGLEVKLRDPEGLLTWAAKDRAVATFSDMADIRAKEAALGEIIRGWLEWV